MNNNQNNSTENDDDFISHLRTLSNEITDKDNKGKVNEKGDKNELNLRGNLLSNFNLEQNITDSLDKFVENTNNFVDLLNKKVGNNDGNEEQLTTEVLDFLISSNLLKDIIINMKNNILNSYHKNDLNEEQRDKYKETIKIADDIIKETNKESYDKQYIFENIRKLEEISNNI